MAKISNISEEQVNNVLRDIHLFAHRPGRPKDAPQPSLRTIAKKHSLSNDEMEKIVGALNKSRLVIITEEPRRTRFTPRRHVYNWHCGKATPNPVMVRSVMRQLE